MTTKSFIKTIGQKGLLADYNTEGKKLQTELIAGDNITIDGNTISSDQVFVATYGTTTYQEIKDAYNAGKICIVIESARYYLMTGITNNSIRFGTVSNTPYIYTFTVASDNKWSISNQWLQTHLTFDTAPTAGSTNPVTSDGIKTAIDEKQNSLTAGDNITIDSDTISSNQVFVATYGTTTYQEIKDAYDAGKICMVVKDNYRCLLTEVIANGFKFASTTPIPNIYSLTLKIDEGWSVANVLLQRKLTFDTTPKAGSKNPVTSDGIKSAIDSRVPAPTSTTGTQVLKCIDGVIQWVTE